MTLGEFISVAQAYIRGEKIQYRAPCGTWTDCLGDGKFADRYDVKQFDLRCEYRIKPMEPREWWDVLGPTIYRHTSKKEAEDFRARNCPAWVIVHVREVLP